MIPYTVYSEGGGVGKTTIAANLAHAHAQDGDDVLVIDLDPQYGCISRLFDVDHAKKNGDADDLVLHMVDRPKGPFEDLIEETDVGVDVIPSHNRLSSVADLLDSAAAIEESRQGDSEYQRYEQLLRVLQENNVPEKYDALVIDPNAKADISFHIAIYTTRNVVIPVEPSGKGAATVEGLHDEIEGISDRLGIDVGVLAAVPNDINEHANDDAYYLEQLEESSYFDAPVAFSHRRSLFRGCWREQCTAFQYVNDIRSRKRDREVQTLEKFNRLVDHIKRVTSGEQLDNDDEGAENPSEAEVA